MLGYSSIAYCDSTDSQRALYQAAALSSFSRSGNISPHPSASRVSFPLPTILRQTAKRKGGTTTSRNNCEDSSAGNKMTGHSGSRWGNLQLMPPLRPRRASRFSMHYMDTTLHRLRYPHRRTGDHGPQSKQAPCPAPGRGPGKIPAGDLGRPEGGHTNIASPGQLWGE